MGQTKYANFKCLLRLVSIKSPAVATRRNPSLPVTGALLEIHKTSCIDSWPQVKAADDRVSELEKAISQRQLANS